MNWEEINAKFNSLIKQLFHDEEWQNRAVAARELGLLEEGRAVNLLCSALKSEKDYIVINRIIEALGRIRDGKATLRIIEKLEEEQKKGEIDKYRIKYILESLIRIKDKRALGYIGIYLDFPDKELQELTQKAFDHIEPNWREIIKKERKKSFEEIFKKG
jgi:hypothetical protein